MPRPPRNFQAHLLYHVVQRGNKGQWVFLDDEDFAFSLALLRKKAPTYGVLVHDYCLTHSQGHWLLEAKTKTGISCLMRDMQGQTSKYLNLKYKHRPWRLFVPLGTEDRAGQKWWRREANPLKNGVNWTPRFFATAIDRRYYESVLKYIEDGPVRAGVCTEAQLYRWSGARARMNGMDSLGLLVIDKGVQPCPAFADAGQFTSAPLPTGVDLTAVLEETSRTRMGFDGALARVRTGPKLKRPCQTETTGYHKKTPNSAPPFGEPFAQPRRPDCSYIGKRSTTAQVDGRGGSTISPVPRNSSTAPEA